MIFSKEKLTNDLKNLKIEKRAFINNEFYPAKKTFSKKSPIDNSLIEGVSSCDKNEIELAVRSAKSSFDSRVWVDLPNNEKKNILLRLSSLMKENIYELSLLDTFETGRSFKNYYEDSIPKAIEIVEWFSESSDKLLDEATPSSSTHQAFVQRVPIGVIACITPWNDPLVPALWKIIPALLMGNSVIIKPAEESSFSILKIAQLLEEAGLPPGVFNVLPGPGEITGKQLALHKDIRGVFFTGSSEVGKKILEYSGQSNMKRVGLECGGKSAFIVSNRCSQIETSAKTLAKNIFYNQGQICSAPSRAFVHKDIFEIFLKALKDESNSFIPSHSLDYKSNVSTLINSEAKVRIENLLSENENDYQDKIVIGNQNKIKNSINPTILINVDKNSILYKTEIFGPVLILNTFENLDEAIDNANDSEYGLAGSLWSNDISEALSKSRLIEAGIVHINSYGEDDMSVPFGGFKQSGVGKDKSLHAFNEYSQLKTTWIKV